MTLSEPSKSETYLQLILRWSDSFRPTPGTHVSISSFVWHFQSTYGVTIFVNLISIWSVFLKGFSATTLPCWEGLSYASPKSLNDASYSSLCYYSISHIARKYIMRHLRRWSSNFSISNAWRMVNKSWVLRLNVLTYWLSILIFSLVLVLSQSRKYIPTSLRCLQVLFFASPNWLRKEDWKQHLHRRRPRPLCRIHKLLVYGKFLFWWRICWFPHSLHLLKCPHQALTFRMIYDWF